MNFNERPMLVFWESTRACPLACRHCRAEAMQASLPGTLSTEKAKAFIRQLTEFEKPFPVLVVTGGDPLMRPDFLELMAYARNVGIPVALSPAVSSLTESLPLDLLKSIGVNVISVSLDGGTPATHDKIRGIEGHFQETIAWIDRLVSSGFTVQVNTTVMKENVRDLPIIASLLRDLKVSIWEVFFLIQVGRGKTVRELSPWECEAVGHFLFDVSHYGFIVRTVEAPFFRRIVAQRRANLPNLFKNSLYDELHLELRRLLGPPAGEPKAQTKGTRDGSGIIFINYKGEVYPSGFLPLTLGNIEKRTLLDIYQNSPELQAIRNGMYFGKCAVCDYRQICGGSRARAYASTGDWLDTDPACAYEPASVLN